MKVLITGGAGFIGSHLADFYAGIGHKVLALDDFSRFKTLGKHIADPTYNMKWLKAKHRNIEFVKADIAQKGDLLENSSKTDVIFHTAGQVAVTTSLENPSLDFRTNVVGTFNVLEAARKTDSTVVFCSTNKVYGDNINKISLRTTPKRYEYDDPFYKSGIPETMPVDLSAHSPYGCSKLCADQYVQEWGRTYGLKVGTFRMSCIYGERQFGVEDQGWIAWFTIATLSKQLLTIYGDGKQVRDVLYVTDLVHAFDNFVTSKLRFGVFNMGGGKLNTISLIELLGMLKEMTGLEPKIRYDEWRAHDQKVYVSDISRAEKEINWRPTISNREGIGRVVTWTKDNLGLFSRSH